MAQALQLLVLRMRDLTALTQPATAFQSASPYASHDCTRSRIVGHVPVWGENRKAAAIHTSNLTAEPAAEKNNGTPSFKDILDTINPLQQLPVIGNFYRSATGSTLSPLARFAGGALFGGPIGAVVALASIAFEGETGTDPVTAALNGFKPSPKAPAPETQNFNRMIDEYTLV